MMKIAIDDKQAGGRIDKFLKHGAFFDASGTRADIIRLIRQEKVTVNGKPAKPSYVLREGDEISIDGDISVYKGTVSARADMKIPVMHEDENLLVIEKPAGIQAHPDAHEKGNTIVNWLMAEYPEIKDVHDDSAGAILRPGIVHRLDRDTSGVMVIAKNMKTFNALKKLFQDGKVSKTYLAIVHGRPEQKKGSIDKPLAKAANYKRQTIASGRTRTTIKGAVTEYEVVKEFAEYSLVEARPKTGRTHQIRVHLWSIGHPVVGDDLYKPKDASKMAIKAKRQLLHAAQLSFSLGGKDFDFDSRPPSDFMAFVFGK